MALEEPRICWNCQKQTRYKTCDEVFQELRKIKSDLTLYNTGSIDVKGFCEPCEQKVTLHVVGMRLWQEVGGGDGLA